MKITLTNGSAAAAEDINNLERLAGSPLPADYLGFLQEHDGAEPGQNIIRLLGDDELAINHFVPAGRIPELLKQLELPERSLPIARDSFGNYFLIDLRDNGSICFWDHENDDTPIRLAADFAEFMDAVESDEGDTDPDSESTHSSRVEEGWRHPDFDKMFAEYLIPRKDTK